MSDDDDFTPQNSLVGHLLIASNSLRDPNFFRTVVLIVRHNEEGAFGLVLNRPSPARVSEVWDKISQSPCLANDLLYFGGPVQGTFFTLHNDPLLSDLEVVPGIFFSADRDSLEKLVANPAVTAKYFLGYSGWGAGQLESELEQDAWLVTGAAAEHLFSEDQDLWERVTRQLSNDALLSALKVKHVPPDPSMN